MIDFKKQFFLKESGKFATVASYIQRILDKEEKESSFTNDPENRVYNTTINKFKNYLFINLDINI